MRRLLLIVLMFVLPLQWTWAAAASLCAHEPEPAAQHFGHHQHEHHGAAAQGAKADQEADVGGVGSHPDCGVCHGLGVAFLADINAMAPPWPSLFVFLRYQAAVPDRSPDTLLRPPLLLVA